MCRDWPIFIIQSKIKLQTQTTCKLTRVVQYTWIDTSRKKSCAVAVDSCESCPGGTTRCRMENWISLGGLGIFLTRCKPRNPSPSCRFVRFVRIVPMWYDPLSNGGMHLIRGTYNISNTLYAPSCRFLWFERFVPMWYDPLSNGRGT